METVEAIEQAAQDAAERRLEIAREHLFDDGEGEGLSGPYCGCETCLVREILDAAWPHLYRLAHHADTEAPV